ncbi:MAG: PepSY-associated TM helix domain-containing protein [Bacteroidota bacterium]
MQFNKRALHRDFGYFYIGLIVSFAASGLMMNHRQSWHPDKYTTETKQVNVQLPSNEKEINEDFSKDLGKKLGIEDKFRRFVIKDGNLKISYEKNDLEIAIQSGKGEIVTFKKTPIISQMMLIHKNNNNNWWIYYSDIFALSLIFIAITGATLVQKGKLSFRQRGWKLALAGIIFPLLFLIFLN